MNNNQYVFRYFVKLIVPILSGFIFFSANAQTFELKFDPNFSQESGASIVTSMHDGVMYMGDVLLGYSSTSNDAMAILQRFFISVSNYYLSSFLQVFQHEVYGHGSRAREFTTVTGYRFSISGSFIDPFGGRTSYRINNISLIQLNTITLAGYEGMDVLSRYLRRQWMFNQSIPVHQSWLYFHGEFIKQMDFSNSTDLREYHAEQRLIHGKNLTSFQTLRNLLYLNLVDPIFWYSLFAQFKYVTHGHSQFEIPMLHFDQWSYLPKLGVVLTPYGPEVQLDNFIRTSEHYFEVALRAGSNGGRGSMGLNIYYPSLWVKENYSLGVGIDVWRQPHLTHVPLRFVLVRNNHLNEAKWGASLLTYHAYNLTDIITLISELGYKTPGYILNERISNGLILRLGARIKI